MRDAERDTIDGRSSRRLLNYGELRDLSIGLVCEVSCDPAAGAEIIRDTRSPTP